MYILSRIHFTVHVTFYLQLGATVLIVIGVGMYSEFNNYSMITGSHHIIAPVAVLLTVGIFLFLLGVVGCVGAFKEQKCLLGMVSCRHLKQHVF